jgi:hypothetical protein
MSNGTTIVSTVLHTFCAADLVPQCAADISAVSPTNHAADFAANISTVGDANNAAIL